MSRTALVKDKQEEYDKIQAQLKEKNTDWENKSNKLEKIKNNIY
jgi:predicted  nucleic acid-binding Zn-ribbon protein